MRAHNMETRASAPMCAVCLDSLLPNIEPVVRSATCVHELHWRCVHLLMAEKVKQVDATPLACPCCRAQFLPSVEDTKALMALYNAGHISPHTMITLARSHEALKLLQANE